MAQASIRPLIGLSASVKTDADALSFHAVADPYIAAVVRGAGAVPVLLPALGGDLDVRETLARLDGLLLTGSVSNVEPLRYGGDMSCPAEPLDQRRDATVLPMIAAALEMGLPVLGICRGMQEINVALGGTLHQRVHEVDGRDDHRCDDSKPVAERFAPRHPVRLVAGGLLASLADGLEATVNSLHGQGIDRLAPGLVVEAMAADGLIEAVRAPAAAFMVGVQWHPEWSLATDPFARALLASFGAAARARARGR